MSPHLQIRADGTVLHLMLDAPERRNALSREMLRALAASLGTLDDDVTAVVLSGRGGTFSAGADLNELTGTSDDKEVDDLVAAVTSAIIDSPRIILAAIEGPCIGAAVDIALACDARVAGRGSHLLVPAVQLGLLYNPTALERLVRRYPPDIVRRLLLLGERFTDERALRAGLVSDIVAYGDAVAHAAGLVSRHTSRETEATAATKALLNALERPDYDPRPAAERRLELLDTPARATAVANARRRHTDRKERTHP